MKEYPYDYISVDKFDDCIVLDFYIEYDKPMDIGEKLQEIDENAYMHGDNWRALLDCYIENYVPELSGTYDPDPEAGTFAAYFEDSPEGEKNAEAMAEIIISLVEDEEKLFDFVRTHSDEIEWD